MKHIIEKYKIECQKKAKRLERDCLFLSKMFTKCTMSSQSENVYYKELEKNNNTQLARTLETNTGLKGKPGPACSSGRPHHSQVVLKRWRHRQKTFAAVTAWRNVSPAWVAKVNRTAGSTCVRASLLGGNQLSNHVLDLDSRQEPRIQAWTWCTWAAASLHTLLPVGPRASQPLTIAAHPRHPANPQLSAVFL